MKKILLGIIVTLFFTQTSVHALSSIQINNVTITNPKEIGKYDQISDTYEIKKTDSYSITFVPTFNQFKIDIIALPFPEKRAEAEADILTLLNISKKDACYLDITEFINPRLDEKYGGEIYRPSFCAELANNPDLLKQNPDVNRDGTVNALDYAVFIKDMQNDSVTKTSDINGDGVLNTRDLSIIIAKLGESVEEE